MSNRQTRNNKKKNVPVAIIAGNGDYYTDRILPIMQQVVPKGSFARGGEYVGGVGGRLLGAKYGQSALGSQAGAAVGRLMGNGLSRLTGFGDYKVQNNSLFKEGMALPPGEAVPSFGMVGSATRVKHREFIKDILVPASPTVFNSTSFVINAGNATTFPWLAALAQNYQQYKVNGMVFEFKSLSSDITSGGPLGSVMMATNYDVLDAAFVDKIHLENAEFSVSAKPSMSQIHTVECDPSVSTDLMRYVRDDTSSTTTSQDARLFDLGKFQIATAGLPGTAGQVLGELWVSYDISLYKPEIVDRTTSSGKAVGVSTSNASIFGTTPTVTGTAFTATVNTITFTSTGQYLLWLVTGGTVLVFPTFTGTATTVKLEDTLLAGSTECATLWTVNVTAAGQTVILDGTGSTTITGSIARVASYTTTLG